MTGMTLTRGDKRRISSMSISLRLSSRYKFNGLVQNCCYVRMSCRRDEVEQSVNSVVTEAGITLDTRLFGQDIIVLTLEVPDDFLEAK